MFGQDYQQIQAWPSPKVWEGKRLSTPEIPEFLPADLRLSSFVSPVPFGPTFQEQDFPVNIFLNKWDNGGPVGNRTLQDDETVNIILSGFIHYLPVDNSIQDDDTANIVLTAMANPTPIDQTLQDDTNSLIALTKFQV